jgi:hypothetical protein
MRKSLLSFASLAAGLSLAQSITSAESFTPAPRPAPPTRRQRLAGAVSRLLRRRTPLRTSWRDQSPERLAAAQAKRARRCERNLRNWRGFHRIDPAWVFEASLP